MDERIKQAASGKRKTSAGRERGSSDPPRASPRQYPAVSDRIAEERQLREEAQEDLRIRTEELKEHQTTIQKLEREISKLTNQYITDIRESQLNQEVTDCRNCEVVRSNFDAAIIRIQKKTTEELAAAMRMHIGALTREMSPTGPDLMKARSERPDLEDAWRLSNPSLLSTVEQPEAGVATSSPLEPPEARLAGDIKSSEKVVSQDSDQPVAET